ncbi:fatty acid--CoA ligase family protein [Thermotoga sp. Ku-13t]|uniref:class I adenylate-forming enzyme family protein n=1 Tax=Thermotoga sp. Ku-13t TaxID=1755813 RepID=UPI0013E9C37F|nr:fatty acid--CoA ligase family protein [Thermotoga sp. Ku-13t]
MKLFFWTESMQKTYEDLVHELNKTKRIKTYIKEKEPYELYKDLLASILACKNVVLLDSDFSDEEISRLGIPIECLEKEEDVEINVSSFEEILRLVERNGKAWQVTLYTSGTTGRPKKVSHNIETLTRYVRIGERFRNNVWAFAYNPTHFAGLQVFFQAFYNENPMIYIFEMDKRKIEKILNEFKVTHISATPTFYRSVVPYFKGQVPSVERVTMGGEKFDKRLASELLKIFPNAKIRNVYASTEAGSLFAAEGEVFEIDPEIADKVRISEDNELLIHRSLLGYSDDFELDGEWYRTGDIVEKIDERHFRFSTRKAEMINIGGYKVNPHEVEDEIRKIEGVIDVVVKARKNAITGNILVAEIKVKNGTNIEEKEKEIMAVLSEKLQRWKVPRILKFVEELETTRTGKRLRK